VTTVRFPDVKSVLCQRYGTSGILKWTWDAQQIRNGNGARVTLCTQ
jgi:hypothetical protein